MQYKNIIFDLGNVPLYACLTPFDKLPSII
jgi:hypothetical protein